MSGSHDLEKILKNMNHKEKKEMKILQSCIDNIWHKAHKLKAHKTNIKEIKKMYDSIHDVKKIIDSHMT